MKMGSPMYLRFALTIELGLAGAVLIGLPACDPDTQRKVEAVTSKAGGVASDLTVKGDTGVVDGQPDFGYKVKFTVTNAGEGGLITVTTRLSTSEGEWSRQQKLSFDAGQVMTLSYFFPEPTINVTNVQATVNVFPQPKKKL